MNDKSGETIQPSWKQVLGVWWYLYWRFFLTILVIVFITSFLGGLLKGLFLEYQYQIGGLLFLLSSLFFVKSLLTKSKFKEFSIVLLKKEGLGEVKGETDE